MVSVTALNWTINLFFLFWLRFCTFSQNDCAVTEIIFLCNTKCTQEHDENWFLAMIFNLFRCIFVIWIECPSNLVYRFLCFIHDCVLLDRWQQAGNSPASFFLIKIYFVSLYFVTPCYFFTVLIWFTLAMQMPLDR